MLAEFETQLADVLGGRLAAPLTGAVDRAPGRAEARLVVAVARAVPVADNLLALRPEHVPGDAAARRVVRMRCDVTLTARAPGDDRAAQVAALDAALYALGDAGFETGAALLPADAADPGFLIRRMLMAHVDPPLSLTLEAEGLFWPIGVAGQTGTPIQAILLRMPLLPLSLTPNAPRLTPGGPAVDLVISAASGGGGRISAAGIVVGPPPRLLVRLVDAGGRPGAGVLGGGDTAPGGARTLTLADGAAALSYTPPATAGLDLLAVTLEVDGAPGVDLARFALVTRP